jgi:hypothetical protein
MSTVEANHGQRDCPRTWEVEAARDGRLQSKDVDSFMRHLASCENCQRRQARLNTLGAVLRALPPVPDDLLAARRMRHRLFAEADQLVLQSPDKPRTNRWLIGGAVALAAAAALALSFGVRRSVPSHPVAVVAGLANGQALQVNIEAQAGTIWHKTQVGNQLRLELETGEIRASVGVRRPGQSLVIHLPDGEIEDLGTVLTVRVEKEHTASVRVFEGRVRLRLAGSGALELGAGDSWVAPPAPKPEPAPSCSAAKLPSAPPLRASAPPNRPERHPAPAAMESPSKETAAPVLDTPQSPSPQQAREEDEAYLRIVELVRAHRFDEARSAAKDYLLRYPKGFRREEVLGVATSVSR